MIVLPTEKCNDIGPLCDPLPEKKMPLMGNFSHLLYTILSPVFSTVFASLNVRTILIFVHRFRLSSLSLILLVNICICDIIVCLGSNNFYMLNVIHPKYAWSTGPIACKMFKTVTMMTNFAQIFSLTVLSMDRTRRLVYSTHCQWQKKHGMIFLPLIWILAGALAAPRSILFDEKEIKKFSPAANETIVVNYACKPAGMDRDSYSVYIIVQFVVGYALPCCFLMINLIICKVMSARHEQLISKTSVNSNLMNMNRQLAWTFNLTGMLFLIVWTPFFALSIIDLKYDLLGRSDLTHMNFTLRCTLLVFGSAKPLIYLLSLKKYRKAFLEGGCMRRTSEAYSEESMSTSDTRSFRRTKELSSESSVNIKQDVKPTYSYDEASSHGNKY